MNTNAVISCIEPVLAERGCFLVEVQLGADQEMVIVLEKETGHVTVEDCAAVNRAVHERFPQDAEDYGLTVTSAGLDQPFKVLRQYEKALGTRVDVKLKGGRRLTGELTEVSGDSIALKYTTSEGKGKKTETARNETFRMTEVNSVSPCIDFNKNNKKLF